MRKVKLCCEECFKPKKMEFRRKDSFVARASDQTAISIGAPTEIELEQNKRDQAATNRPFKKQSEIRSFLTLQTIQEKKQVFTLH